MTSILNLDARYRLSQNPSTGLFSVFCETLLIGQSFSEHECKWMATQHFDNFKGE